MFAGIIARPRATSDRTNSGVIGFPIADCQLPIGSEPEWRKRRSLRAFSEPFGEAPNGAGEAPALPKISRPRFSRIAMNSISGVMMPRLAYASCVTAFDFARRTLRETPNAECRTSNAELLPAPFSLSDFDVGRWTLARDLSELDVGCFLSARSACDSDK